MQNKKLMVLIVLVIAAVFSLIYGITASLKGPNRPAKSAITRETEPIPPAKNLVLKERNALKSQFKSWGRNPFVQEKIQEKPPAPAALKLTLNAVIWDEKTPRVFINNTLLSKGGKIGKNTVVDIKRNSVILHDGTRVFELKLR